MTLDHKLETKQTDTSIAKNISFFGGNQQGYNKNVQRLDTYLAIRTAVNEALQGMGHLLDIGNGGVFDYDTDIVQSIVALDLVFDEFSPAHSDHPNITFRAGSALDIPAEDGSFDGVLMTMLLHHLVGITVKDCIENCRRTIAEALRVLRPGGKLIIMESCVPRWFYRLERSVFRLAVPLFNALLRHPATLQYPARAIAKMLEEQNLAPEILHIPKGRWVLQYGFKFPAALTPVDVFRFIARKPEA